MTDSSTDIDLILASRRKHPVGAPRSPLRLWLDAHLNDLIANPPDWTMLVERLSARGMRDAYGRPLKPLSVARAFSRALADRHIPKPAASELPRAVSRKRTAEPLQIRPTHNPKKETP